MLGCPCLTILGFYKMKTVPGVILVVDDEPSIRELLREVLGAEGYAVETTAGKSAALARLESGDVALLSVDLELPGLDGLELCRQVRARQALVSLPIVVMSTLDDESARAAAFVAGANHYLPKPFHVDGLITWVRTWIPRPMHGSAGLHPTERRATDLNAEQT
jgi:DNA-binding response OmpR family regulator